MPPQMIIIAGPNGAGKSTCAPFLVPPALPFINADEIALTLGDSNQPGREIKAGRLMLAAIDKLVDARNSFVIETTLANKMLSSRIPQLQYLGYEVQLFYIWVPSANVSINRVEDRVRRGGHDIPTETIIRRYRKSLENFFNIYSQIVDGWRMFRNLNSGPELIAEQIKDGKLNVVNQDAWNQCKQAV